VTSKYKQTHNDHDHARKRITRALVSFRPLSYPSAPRDDSVGHLRRTSRRAGPSPLQGKPARCRSSLRLAALLGDVFSDRVCAIEIRVGFHLRCPWSQGDIGCARTMAIRCISISVSIRPKSVLSLSSSETWYAVEYRSRQL